MARSQNRSIAEVERRIADEILAGREQARKLSGGHGPGVHVVAGDETTRIDRDVVKVVPAGTIPNFDRIRRGGGRLKAPGAFATDKSLYLDPANTDGTGLAAARMVGYIASGTYLNGNNYARTAALKQIESTPGGRTGWTGLTRVYSGHEALGDIILDESDVAAARMTVLVPDNTLNATVGGHRATLARLRAEDGPTMTDLNWVDGRGRSFSLKIRQVDDRSVASLMLLAESLMRRNR